MPVVPEALRAFARAHSVSAEVRPHYDVSDHKVVQHGFDLALLALKPARCPGDPGCPECERAHASLVEIARRVLPPGWAHAVLPFEAAFHYRRETRWSPELEAVLEIAPPALPPGEAAARLAELRRTLRGLDVVTEGRPPERRAA